MLLIWSAPYETGELPGLYEYQILRPGREALVGSAKLKAVLACI